MFDSMKKRDDRHCPMWKITQTFGVMSGPICRTRELTSDPAPSGNVIASSETWWNLNFQLIGSRCMSYILPALRGRLDTEEKEWSVFLLVGVHSWEPQWAREDLCKEGHRQGCSVQTQLSNLCAYSCLCTHTGCLLTAIPTGLQGWGLNKSPAPLSLSRGPASLSTHYFSNPWAVINDNDAFCILSPLLCCSFHPSIYPLVCLFLILSVPRV